MAKNTIQNTIIVSFCLGSLLLTTLYGFFIYFGAKNLEDHFFSTQLESITQNYLARFEDGQENVSAFSLKSYIGTDDMDQELFERIGHYPNGSYELQIDSEEGEGELQFSVNSIPGTDKRFYVVYDVSGLEITDQQEKNFITLLVVFGCIVCGIGCLIGYFLATRVTRPIALLSQRVQNINPENIDSDLVSDLPLNEIHHLGKTLEEAHRRIHGFVSRERDFTRNASHELRTPLTVIKGATDILEQSEACPVRPLQRIQRSINEMQLNIDTFLTLAREEEQDETLISINDSANKIIHDYSFLVAHNDVSISIREKAQCQQICSPQLFEIVLSNLVRNSARHTAQGTIAVIIDKNHISVQDTGSGISPEKLAHVTKPGYADKVSGQTGFGLTIVSKICARKNWSFDINSAGQGMGCTVTIGFSTTHSN